MDECDYESISEILELPVGTVRSRLHRARLQLKRHLKDLMQEYHEGRTKEARLAHDADQLALLLELKDLMDVGYQPPSGWIGNVIARVKTATGQKIAQTVMDTQRDGWWTKMTS